jgi:hypothetical protein
VIGQLLFRPIPSTHAKNGKNGDSQAVGDRFDVKLFEMPAEFEEPEQIEVAGQENVVYLDAKGSTLYYLVEANLNNLLREIEKTLPSKRNHYTSSMGTSRATSGKHVLSVAGRTCVSRLKDMLPALSAGELKKMCKKVKIPLSAAEEKDKAVLMEKIAFHLLPGYPYEDPFGPYVQGADSDDVPLCIAEPVHDA